MEKFTNKRLNETEATELFFWKTVEKDMGLVVPTYIKNITNLCGFDTPITFQNISEKNIEEFEMFAREEMHNFIKPNENEKNYYNIYHICKDKFRIVPGHKNLILVIANYMKNIILEQGSKYFEKMISIVNNDMNIEEKQPSQIPITFTSVNRDKGHNIVPRFNINGEKLKLYNVLLTWMKNQPGALQIKELFSTSLIEVKIEKIAGTGENQNYTYNYIASIACPICSAKCQVRQMKYGSNGKTRWVKANFERHVRRHMVKQINGQKQELINHVQNHMARMSTHQIDNFEERDHSMENPDAPTADGNNSDFEVIRIKQEYNCDFRQSDNGFNYRHVTHK